MPSTKPKLTRLLATGAALLLGIGIALWPAWPYLERHWASYRVASAPSYSVARQRLAWFEYHPEVDTVLRDLVRRWGTGNARFDQYLASYASDPASSEAFRKAFSRNLAWRDGLLEHWAGFWIQRSHHDPRQRIRAILSYLELLDATHPPKPLTWREVLDVQAVFTLTGQSRLAARLSPENWQQRYEQWRRRNQTPQPLKLHLPPYSNFPGDQSLLKVQPP